MRPIERNPSDDSSVPDVQFHTFKIKANIEPMTNATNELKVVTKGRLNLFGPEDKFDFDDDEA